MDYGHAESDRRLKTLERKLKKEYNQAYKEMKAKADAYFVKFADEDKVKRAMWKEGKITKHEYQSWRQAKMITGKRYRDMENILVNDMLKADKIATEMISGHRVDIYTLNVNYGMYEVCEKAGVNLSFSLYSHETVERLIKDNPTLLPKPSVSIPAEKRWAKSKIRSAVTQGVLQGESVYKIATRLRKVTDSGVSSSIRYARTATTSAESAGRINAYHNAEDLGIELEKTWLATLDDRTREEHANLDGQSVPVDDVFETNGYEIAYPGDPDAANEMVWNCRCTLVCNIKNHQYRDERWSRLAPDVTYEEWKKGRR
jgi:SPP1 gp7 family putative phage head morphogenesis protein